MEKEETKVCKRCGKELPLSMFWHNAWGATNYCTECHNERVAEGKEQRKKLKQQAVDAVNARKLRLEDFSPRELMARLKELGYEGTLKYTRVETIDISKL